MLEQGRYLLQLLYRGYIFSLFIFFSVFFSVFFLLLYVCMEKLIEQANRMFSLGFLIVF